MGEALAHAEREGKELAVDVALAHPERVSASENNALADEDKDELAMPEAVAQTESGALTLGL